MMESLWRQFDRIIIFDTETTGLNFTRDQIIEIGAAAWSPEGERAGMDAFIRLPVGRQLPPFIVQLTGITDQRLQEEGLLPQEAAEDFASLLEGAQRPLLAAYNAQFDLNFLYHLLQAFGLWRILDSCRHLDVMTVYKDRRDYPHKLCNAIEAYQLTGAANSHRAIDDARATLLLLQAMAAERDDLDQYINLFGVHPKYGLSGTRFPFITYRRQPYSRQQPLYQLPG